MRTNFVLGLICGLSIPMTVALCQEKEATNAELKALYTADQSDREPPNGESIDWNKVGPRDKARRKRVLELYTAGTIKTGEDYYLGAMVLQHGEGDDQLLAHEMCVSALALGYTDAKWLAAASEDRWLEHIGRKQRFATQYSAHEPEFVFHLNPVDPTVTDAHRKTLGCPPLAAAKEREKEMNQK
jgi:hypothetical protein